MLSCRPETCQIPRGLSTAAAHSEATREGALDGPRTVTRRGLLACGRRPRRARADLWPRRVDSFKALVAAVFQIYWLGRVPDVSVARLHQGLAQ